MASAVVCRTSASKSLSNGTMSRSVSRSATGAMMRAARERSLGALLLHHESTERASAARRSEDIARLAAISAVTVADVQRVAAKWLAAARMAARQLASV